MMPMTDAQLEVFLGIADLSKTTRAKIMAAVTPEKRKLYDEMAELEVKVKLWQDGLGPKPEGVIICGCGRRGRHKHGRR
jgi:hypothetical protein